MRQQRSFSIRQTTKHGTDWYVFTPTGGRYVMHPNGRVSFEDEVEPKQLPHIATEHNGVIKILF